MLSFSYFYPKTVLIYKDITLISLVLLLIIGFILLAFAAQWLVTGATHTAQHFRISPLLMGLTIISLITSAPELVVSLVAITQGSTGLAVGNVVGSNIANIGLILGITILIVPLNFPTTLLKRELPLLLLVTLLAGLLIYNLTISRYDALIMLVALLIVGYLLYRSNQYSKSELTIEPSATSSISYSIFKIIVGILGLLLSARLIVYAATNLANIWGVNEVIIGLTITAIGTSLPELATSIAGVLKRQHALAIGGILGSNIVNLLLILSLPSLIQPINLEAIVYSRDFAVLLSITLLFYAMVLLQRKRQVLSRLNGFILLTFYLSYMGILIVAVD